MSAAREARMTVDIVDAERETNGGALARRRLPSGPKAAAARPSRAKWAPADAEPDLLQPLGDQLVISCGHSILLSDLCGQLGAAAGGFFHFQSRFLKRAELRIAGRMVQGEPATASCDRIASRALVKLPRSSLARAERDAPDPSLEVQSEHQVRDGLTLRYRITNRSAQRIKTSISWRLSADFVDQGKSNTLKGLPRVGVARRWSAPATLLLTSLHPRLRHASRVRFSGPEAFRSAGDRVFSVLHLEPQAECVVELELTPLFDPAYAAELPDRPDADNAKPWQDGCSQLIAASPAVQAAWDAAASDLRTLQLGDGQGEERFTPAAGIPHYLALFGRDALMSGWQTSLLNPATMRGALSLVGR
ncbi:MAG TPA: glycogen debranching N-terminal domain-containing protein, partial [Caulobacteraceae bacterium]|nr:glycogen debranching N-terminal domain-containing protein [Caulobacteraceae bacterium]